MTSCTLHKTKPKTGKGRKAWEKFEKERGQAPASIEYTPNYEHEYKGWICEWFGDDVSVNVSSNYGAHTYHNFYHSNEL
jgi:hypothetical protein